MIKLDNIVSALDLSVVSGWSHLDREVSGAYASDLLSDVMGHAVKDNLWITMQTHGNIVAVATLKELSAIIVVNGGKPDENALKKADNEGIVILCTNMRSFEVCGRLYNMMKNDAMVQG